ncbi:MAG: helix-turn-helix transcriptional regulator [Coriobacteriaceae bacterium]|uniref:heat shock protein transcriptional repressor HspR n=1 Tax=Tractidigestivibacter sp. TaxID=2847320 RepID=UPI002A90DC2D|nr:helix-turn-helix transcriptional regulator [Tractidigestivibacter sp.]MCI6845210.1 helix-turn-helix transcriptional regulator [Coriobacteriaceae bacterium]MCI7439234.1 helix-turn-helix transcriptional regulator [Coriobacteriaceae bacterium]MDD7584821.1 helix-turn-helix transcriptional regulator [Coriobacteriaceae bacterium]MDY5270660.1 helix-turn-helix transcriptional regulator [Tractidigestivibacter sp.]
MARNDGASDARRARGPHDRGKPLYMISVAAELTGMHPQTLRVYEQKGLVTPGRSRGNTRLYSQADIDRLNLISKLTDEGINLAGVVRIMDMRERACERDEEIDHLRARVRQLEDEVHEYRMRERITALARYDGQSPEQVMRGLLESGGNEAG